MRRPALPSALQIALALVVGGLASVPCGAQIALSGRVELPDGAPAAGCDLSLVPPTSRYEFGLLVLAGHHRPEPAAVATTGQDGSYRLEAPDAGMWRLYIGPDGYRPMELFLLPLLEDETLPTLRLTAETTVKIRVLGADGEPAAGARVMAGWPQTANQNFRRNPWRPAWRQAFANDRGVARLGRAADEALTVWARIDGHLESEVAGVDGASRTIRLAAAEQLPLQVVDALGRPLAGALIRMGERRWPIGTTDEEGRVALPMPAEGDQLIRVYTATGGRGEQRLQRSSWVPGEPASVVVTPPSTRSGRVLDAASGAPLAGAFTWRARDPASFVLTDASGGYSLPIREDEVLWVWGAAPGYLREAAQASAGGAGPTLSLRRAVRVRGAVVDENDSPVADAEIIAQADLSRVRSRRAMSTARQLRRGVSGADGSFEIGNLSPDVFYILEARKAGFAAGRLELPSPGSEAPSPPRIVLERGRRAVGRVIDIDGEPVAGARVALRPSLRGGDPRQMLLARMAGGQSAIEAFSDASGGFSVPDLGAGSYSLEVSASGHAPKLLAGVEILSEPETDLGEVVLEPGVSIEGYVTDVEGAPLEGAEVQVAHERSRDRFVMAIGRQSEAPATYSDASGYFEVPDLLAGDKHDLSVELTGFASASLPGIEAPTSQPLSVRLERASSLRGRVVDAGGRGIGGADVWLQIEISTAGISSSRMGGRTKSDEDGVFVIGDLNPGEFQLSARAEGYSTTEIKSLVVEAGEDLEGVEVVLEPGAWISGRVLSPTGRPVAAAQLMVRERSESAMRTARFHSFGHSDGEGRYRIDGIAPGPQALIAQHEDYQPVTVEVDVRLGGNSVDVTFEGGATLSGRVIDESGTPVVGARIALDADEFQPWGSPESFSNSSGKFSITGLPDGVYSLRVRADGFAPGELTDLRVGPGDLSGLEVRLSPGSAIVGQLYGLEPSDYALVEVYASAPPRSWSMGSVGADGSYRVEDLAPGEYTISARLANTGLNASDRVEVVAGAPETVLDLEFEGGLTLTGLILDGTEPLRGAQLSLSGIDVSSQTGGSSNNDGRFEIQGIQPGRHRLSISSYESGLDHHEELEILADRDIVVRIATARVSGTILDATDSSPLRDVSVRLEPQVPEPSAFSFRFGSMTTTDSGGFFRFSEASAGSYRLVATKEGYAPAEMPIVVSEGLDQENLEIRLSPTEGVRVYVTLPDGRPAREFSAAIVDAAGRPLTTTVYRAGEDGSARLSLAPGTWTVYIGAAGSATWSGDLRVPGDPVRVPLSPEARLTVRVPDLEESSALAEVRITSADGRPFRSVQWMWSRDTWPMSQGSATISALAPGTWSVQVEAPDGRLWQEQVTLAAGENPELVLR